MANTMGVTSELLPGRRWLNAMMGSANDGEPQFTCLLTSHHEGWLVQEAFVGLLLCSFAAHVLCAWFVVLVSMTHSSVTMLYVETVLASPCNLRSPRRAKAVLLTRHLQACLM